MTRIQDIHTLAPLQQAMLVRAVLEPDSGAYVEQLRIELAAAPDPDALRRAWAELSRRHPVLRSSFHHAGLSEPQQVVHAETALPWRVEDWRDGGGPDLDALAVAERERGFDLTRPPLFRLVLVLLPDSAVLVWTFHHLLLDGWSLGRILTEIDQGYRAALDGQSDPAAPAEPFSHFVRWLRAADPAPARAYWSTRLAGAATAPLTGERGGGGGERRILLGAEESEQVRELCRPRAITLGTLAAAAWAACLAEPGGLQDVTFTSLVSGRPADLAGADRIVGMLVNTVASRARFAAGETVHAFLTRFQGELALDRRHGWLPLDEVARAAGLGPTESVLVVENYPLDRAVIEDSPLAVRAVTVHEQADVPLVVAVVPGERIELRLATPPGGLTDEALDTLGERLAAWLVDLAEGMDQELAELLGRRERLAQQRLRERVRAAPPEADSLAAAILAAGPAVDDGDEIWSAERVLTAAREFARAVAAGGPGPVALVGDTDAEMVARILGCVLAGRAYVPLEGSDPRRQERLAHVGAQIVDPLPTDGPAARPDLPPPAPDTTAYLLHTSGSTGRPKAVVQTQAGVHAHARRYAAAIGLQPGDRVCMTASFAYDAAVMDIFAAATVGATLLLGSPRRHTLRELRERILVRATVLHTTPSLFRLLAEERLPAGIRMVVLGGEGVLPSDLDLFDAVAPAGCLLVNGYGPSESSTGLQWFADRGTRTVPVPAGVPVAGTEAWIIDAEGRRDDAPWARGEIVLASDAVSRGYHGDDAAEAFRETGAGRSYATGDLGRRRPSGCIEVLGRRDDQVQIGAVRVEPGEVRATLAALPGVTAAEVLAVGEGAETRLHAWVTPGMLDPGTLLREVAARLPAAFVPRRVDCLDRLPLLANGKVDRAALRSGPVPVTAGPSGDPVSEPVSEPEPVLETVLAVFTEVVGSPVDPDRPLFELGAHSLDALRIAGRLEARLSRRVPLQLLFEHPAARALAAALAAAPGAAAAGAIPRARRDWRSDGTPMVTRRWPSLSLFFFAGHAEDPAAAYRLMLDAAVRADELGLEAVWTPERHFDEFGGVYPNPSVIAAFLAARTRRIRLRAGSVVLPLHDPVRVAEEWAVVDQLSGGRVDLAIASGWHQRDFVLAPDAYHDRKGRLTERIELLGRLWSGEPVELPGPDGESHAVRTWPRPVQGRVPLWLTAQSAETFELAGAAGHHVLTNLNYKSLDELTERVARYRRAGGGDGRVTVMTHTLVGSSDREARESATEAYAAYTRRNLVLQHAHARGEDRDLRPAEADVAALARRSAERMVRSGGLVGDLDRCRERLAELAEAGADEVACLIDFGVPEAQLLEGVELLGELVEGPARRSGPRSAELPAAPLQAQLWVLDQLSDTPGTWMIPTLVRLEGVLDPAELRERLRQVVARHEALRTSLQERRGRVVQVVEQDGTVDLEVRPVADEAEALRQARRILDEGLDLTKAPLVRAVLFAVTAEHHVLLLACHHAVADGSSTVVLARELLNGVSGPDPLQLGDWAAWQAAREERGETEQQEAWWDAALRDLPPRPRLGDGVADGRRAVHPVPFEPGDGTALRALCRDSGSTAFEVVLTAFAQALGALSGQDDLLIGLHHANRDRPELEGVVGPLVNLLPFRARLGADGGLAGVRRQVREALEHHAVPYARLAARHGGARHTGADPLLDAALLYQNLPEVSSGGPVRWTRIDLPGGRARFPLTLVATERADGLSLQLEVDAGLIREAEADRLVRGLRTALDALLGVPRAAAPARIDAAAARYSAGPHLLAAFVEHAGAAPDAVAVTGADGSLTRAELLDSARRLAGAIRSRVPAGTRVGVQVRPGVDMLVAVYGILLADCTVVPLDPRTPAVRRRLELQLAEVELAVADTEVEVPWLAPAQSGPPRTDPPSGRHLAYVIFTSGSTGVPKPVAVGHDSVRALIGWARTAFSETELSGALLTAPIRFDMSVFGLYTPLAGPGSVVVVDDLTALLDGPPPAPVSLVYTVPSALRALLSVGELPGTVGTVNLGGEALPPDLLASLLDRVGRVCNLYGPTESTSNAFFEDYTGPAEPTIGRPIAGTGAWIRDTVTGGCAAVGETGELVLTGAGLAVGYLGDPQHPSFTADGYRTGDLARLLPDGRTVYLGRSDDQVKVRGHRVQLGEIETALNALDGVRAAACRHDDGTLEAWIVPSAGCAQAAQAEPARARAWADELGEALPAHLLPSRWILLPELPLTRHGKLDRAALAAVTWAPLPAGAFTGPAQLRLAAVWEEVLGTPVPDAEADFFTLGGHSLLAITLCRRIEDELGVRVPLRTLFDHPTVSSLEAALRGAEQAPATAAELVADPAAAAEPFPLTELQQAYWVGGRDDLELGSVGTQGYVEIDTEVPAERVAAAIRALVDRHAMLRAVVEPDGTQRVLTDPGEFPIVVEDLGDVPEAELTARRAARSHHRQDPADWPLVRVWMARLRERTRIQLSVPALVADAHSVYLLARELTALLEDRPLPPPGPSYRDLALALAAEDRTADDAEFAELAPTFPGGPLLPLAVDQAELDAVRFDRRELRLDATTWHAVREAGAAHGLTPAGTLLAAYAWVLGAWAEDPHFAISVTFFDRPPVHPEVDRVVGDFTSARLVQVTPADDLGAFASGVQRRLWEALDGRARDAVRCVRALRRLGRPHTFPVVFTSTLGLDVPARGSLGEVVYALTQTSQVWLDHKVREDAGELVSTWDFVDGLFRPGVVEAMMEAFEATLRALPEDGWRSPSPGVPAGQALVRPAARAVPWERTGPALLHETLLGNVDPDAPALVAPDGESLTRRQLASAAAAVAGRLVAAGLRVGETVAVESRHGWRQAAAALGVLAAGGAFVPVDPSWPQRRIDAVLRTAGTERAVEPGDWGAGLRRVTLDDGDRWADATLPDVPVGPQDLAYVLFTSGSTGEPKGVEITHAGAMNTIADLCDRFGLDGDRVLGVSGLHFDLSVFDLFGSWLVGGAVVHPDSTRDPAVWVERLTGERITVWNSVPALAEMLVAHLETTGTRLPGLRLVLLSGDWIPVTLPDRLRAVAPGCRVVSLGGATEASIWSIAHEVGEHDPGWASVPYGRPLRNQGVHVLDGRRHERPDWVTGEIHLSGFGVALGYRGDEDRTRAAFWRHPDTGERYYATGDLGRYRPDGTIEFLGRRDSQVKVRGHRVELGEIEAVLLEHPLVRQAAVTAPRGRSGQRQLVAHVVTTLDRAELRAHLAASLPDAHVPRTLRLIDALPLTANGKVDRSALDCGPEPEPVASTPVGDAVLGLFRAVLERDGIGPEDDFFAVGGDSVLAIRLLSRVEREFGRRVPIRSLFANPTARGLSALLRPDPADPAGPDGPLDPADAAGLIASATWPASVAELDPRRRAEAKARQGQRAFDGPARPLPRPRVPDALRARRSVREFDRDPLPAAAVEQLLGLVTAEDGRRLYPSDGDAHGVQVYLQTAPGRVADLAGSWFADGLNARLLQVSAEGWDPGTAGLPPNRALSEGAAFAVVLVADLDTLEPLYGERAQQLATLEAGYLGQLLAGQAADHGLALCPVGAIDDRALDTALDLGPRRRVLHVLLGGRPLSARLRSDAAWSGTVAAPSPGPVLLTGATGLLGTALLAELLERGHEVHCLLRGDAASRLATVLSAEGLEEHADRVFAWPGGLDSLGRDVREHIGTVVHSAADISLAKDYVALAPVNVEGTRRVLDLCARGAELHYVSSLSVFREHGRAALQEGTPPPADPPGRSGYAQSKWVGENLVRSFVAAGGRAHIHRLALVTDARPGADDYFGAMVRGSRTVGAYPESDLDVPVIRRRVAAAAIAATLGTPPRTWHLQEAAPTLAELAVAAGNLAPTSPEEWLQRVESAVADRPGHPLASYLDRLRGSLGAGVLGPLGPRGGRLDSTDSWRRLADLGVRPDRDLTTLLQELV
ncbi:amino acid adenylation domain-containing protein [Kitasatospora sp. NPDC087314]|uniref:amino acid adenylation domain-containing protein n=1 Tax=Kitasatospora sp. NPDC087314 TaxID=3364068 RepID=UPI003805DD4C